MVREVCYQPLSLVILSGMIRKVFPILAISVFSAMLGMGIIAPLMPLYAESMGASGMWVGIIFAAMGISRSVFTPVFGRLSDRRGRKVFICTGLFIYAVISLGYAWASQISELTMVRLLHGFASAMIIPIAQAYVGELSPGGEEGTWMGYFNGALFAGFGIGPLMGGVLTDYFSMEVAFYTMGGLSLMAFLLALSLLPEIRRKKGLKQNPGSSFRNLMGSSVMRGVLGFELMRALGRGSFFCFLPLFAAFFLGLTAGQIGVLVTTNILLLSISQVFSGKMADIFERKKLVIMGGLLNLGFLALTPLAQNFGQLLGLCLIGGIAEALAMPAESALAIGEGRRYGMGSAIGVFAMAMSLGMGGGPIIGGLVADLLKVSLVFYFGAGMIALGTGVFFWFTRK